MWPTRGSLEKCKEEARPAVGAGCSGRRTAVPPGFRVSLVLHVPDAELTLAWMRRGVEALKLQLLTGLGTAFHGSAVCAPALVARLSRACACACV